MERTNKFFPLKKAAYFLVQHINVTKLFQFGYLLITLIVVAMQKDFFIFAFRDKGTIMRIWLLLTFCIIPIVFQAQNHMISGKVTDKEYNPLSL